MRLVDHLKRGYADRAARPMYELHALRQQVIDAILDNGMRLSAADLHDDPGFRLHTANLIDDLACYAAITILIEIFHRSFSRLPCSSTIGASSSVSWSISSSS